MAIVLDATTKTVTIVLAGATTANKLLVNAQLVDTVNATGVGTIGAQDALSNGTTPVTVVSAPSSGHTKTVNYLSVQNVDTASAVVTLKIVTSGVGVVLVTRPLAPGQVLSMTPDGGWAVGWLALTLAAILSGS